MATRRRVSNVPLRQSIPADATPKPFTLFERLWLAYSSELVYSIMEPWEIIIVHLLFLGLIGILAYGLTFLPAHVRVMAKRTQYYLYGTSSSLSFAEL